MEGKHTLFNLIFTYLYKLQVILCYNLENTTPNEPVTYDLDTSTVHQTGNTENGKGFVVL